MMQEHGVERLFCKRLAPNDNSKNQIYLGGDFSILAVLPAGELASAPSSSRKSGHRGRQILKSHMRWSWLDAVGCAQPVPNAQLILYPQYPEVRLSGFLRGCGIDLGRYFDPYRNGRMAGRILFMGVSRDGQVFAHLALPESALSRYLDTARPIGSFGLLTEIGFAAVDGRSKLLAELRRINLLGWIVGKRLVADGTTRPCNSQNCGGYTLEAELGISPNGLAEPDYYGWEVKSYTVPSFARMSSGVITLMTPEPDGGYYKTHGPEAFIRRFGYADVSGRPDRINFGGIHLFAQDHARTGMRLVLTKFDATKNKILDAEGGVALMRDAECGASWSFRKLIDHWKRKHDKAAFVPNMAKSGPPRCYRYSSTVNLGEDSEFPKFLAAFISGSLYYDPGLKLEAASTKTPRSKRRSQFRMRVRDLYGLYRTFEEIVL